LWDFIAGSNPLEVEPTMRDLAETSELSLDPGAVDCLQRTRSSVLNVLLGVGVVVALSGVILRGQPAGAFLAASPHLSDIMLGGLILIFVASTLLRRTLGRRTRLSDPTMRGRRFFWGHVLPAVVGGLAAPLGLVHGWLLSPRLETIIPFWVTALLLGVLAYPRGRELEGFDLPMHPPGEPA
jgi:hypothetical protein